MGVNHIPLETWDDLKTQYKICNKIIYQNTESDTEYFVFVCNRGLSYSYILTKGTDDCIDYENNYKDDAVVQDPPWVFN